MKLLVFDRDGIGLDYAETTPDEIMAVHPKCGECRHWGNERFNTPDLDRELPCTLTYDDDRDAYDWKDGLNDYCSKWEAKVMKLEPRIEATTTLRTPVQLLQNENARDLTHRHFTSTMNPEP